MNLTIGSMDLTSLCSNPEKCLCWLIILLDILAIFYLVFVSFYKVTRLVSMIGWIWIGVLLTADIIILAIHPCILTLLCILFTIMIMAAILSVVLPGAGATGAASGEKKSTPKPKSQENYGSYVVREINADKYCFELYDRQNDFLVRSFHCYQTIGDTKQAIAVSRESGQVADLEDRTVSWIKEVNHPKFEMFKKDGKYYFRLSLNSKFIIFLSKAFNTLSECKRQLDKTMIAVASSSVYICVDRLSDSEAKQYENMKAIGTAEDAVISVANMVTEVPTEPEKPQVKPESRTIMIQENENKPLWELYNTLSSEQKDFFNGLRKAAQEKAEAKEFEYPDQLCYKIDRSYLLRIRIRWNTVEAVFTLIDPVFKQMQNAVIRVANVTYYSLALETLNKKYASLMAQKSEQENQTK